MPSRLSDDELNNLITGIAQLHPEVSALQEEVRRNREAHQRETAKARALIVVAIIFGAIGLIVGTLGVYEARVANKAIGTITVARTESRVVTCAQDNAHITGINGVVEAMEGVIRLTDVPNSNRTPDQQAQVDMFVHDSIGKLEAAREPMRDCSPKGIDAFYNAYNR